jgi:hypothetical protein
MIIRIGGSAVVEPEALEDYRARIRQLEEENAHLREAAKTFGDLAERLKRALDAELRRADHNNRLDRARIDDQAVVRDAGPAGLAK